MPNRRPNWNSVLRSLAADRITPQPVRETGRTVGAHITMSAWTGVSCRRYAVTIHDVARVEPFELLDATVLFVGRDLDGRARIASGHRDLTITCAEGLIEKALARGLTEVHVHRGARGSDARLKALVDLEVPNLRIAAAQQVAA